MSDPLSDLLNRVLGNALSALGNAVSQTLRVGTTNNQAVEVIANNNPSIRIDPTGDITLLDASGSSVRIRLGRGDAVFQFPESNNEPGACLVSRGDGSTVWSNLRLEDKLNVADFNKANIGLGDVDNTADIDKPLSSRMQAAIAELPTFRDLDTKVDYSDFTKTSLGLARVDNTSDIDKPISNATQNALSLLAQQSYVDAQLQLKGNQSDIQYLYGNTVNKSEYNKTTIGLAYVDNTADIDKPVSIVQQAALDLKVDVSEFTKENIGLGLVDNVPDSEKPVSGPQQAALDLKVNAADILGIIAGKSDDSELEALIRSTDLALSNKLSVSDFNKANIGLGDVDNVPDVAKPVSVAQQAAIDTKLSIVYFTKANIGLGLVDNVPDVDKPISNDTLVALDTKANIDDVRADIASAVASLDKTHVGLDQVDNTRDADKPVSIAQQAALDLKVNSADLLGLIAGKSDDAELEALASAMQVAINSRLAVVDFTKSNIGLGNVDDTADIDKPVSAAQQSAIDAAIADKASTNDIVTVLTVLNAKLDAASFTKNNLGIGNVDNTADVDKPVSTAQKAYIDSVRRISYYAAVYTTTKRVYSRRGVNQLVYNSVLVGSNFSTSTGVYTAPASGMYAVYIYGNRIKEMEGELYLRTNNGQQMSFYNSDERSMYQGSVWVLLNEGDTLSILCKITDGSFIVHENGGCSIGLMS